MRIWSRRHNRQASFCVMIVRSLTHLRAFRPLAESLLIHSFLQPLLNELFELLLIVPKAQKESRELERLDRDGKVELPDIALNEVGLL